MINMRVLVRTDASVDIGSGHLMRCLTLAERLREDGAEVSFICRDLPGAMFDMLQSHNFPFGKLPPIQFSQELDAQLTISTAQSLFADGIDWVVVDHYSLAAEWEGLLRSHTHKLLVIDDLANRLHDCDMLLDQNYYRDFELRYKNLVPNFCLTLLGPAYVLLREEFIHAKNKLRERDGVIRHILVFFGGSDPTNQTQKVLDALKLLQLKDIKIDVVVGIANPHKDLIRTQCNQSSEFNFHCQVSNMAELISNADLAIGAGGAAMWERCYLGLPTITVVFATNQQSTTEDVAKLGAIEYLGWSDQLDASDYANSLKGLIDNPLRVKEIGQLALSVLSKGDVPLSSLMQGILDNENLYKNNALAVEQEKS